MTGVETEIQCNDPFCTRDGIVYGMCPEHAPDSWLSRALEELDFDEDQEREIRENLDETAAQPNTDTDRSDTSTGGSR